MPELEPLWDELTGLSGGGDHEARMLSLVNPPPYLSGCSQAVWSGDAPFLIRNYDYHPRQCEGTFLLTAWTGTRVIASSDCLWGVLDGMNEHGLCVALSYGGRTEVGDGFGIPLILRYVLEVSRSTREAVEHLTRIPCHMTYNVSVLDSSGAHVVVHLAPDSAPQVVQTAVATNHQETGASTAELDRSRQRSAFMEQLLGDPHTDGESLAAAFLRPPLFTDDYDNGFGTLYTARYEPRSGRVTFIWPHNRWVRSFDTFDDDTYVVDYATQPVDASHHRTERDTRADAEWS